MCLQHLWSVSPSFPWLGFSWWFTLQPLPLLPPYGRASRAAPCYSASRSKCISIILWLSFSPTVEQKVGRVVGAPTFPAPTLCGVSFCVSERADPSTMSSSPLSATRWESRLLLSRSPALGSPWRSWWIAACFVAAFRPRSLMPLLLSGFSWCLLPSVLPFGAPRTTFSLPCPLGCVTPARRVILL
jgi:hypothetical protein